MIVDCGRSNQLTSSERYGFSRRVLSLDCFSVGLIDITCVPSLLPEHSVRLQQLLDDPSG